MKYKVRQGSHSAICFFNLLFIIFIAVSSNLFSQSTSKPTRQSAIDAFSKGEYVMAYGQFTELLTIYPKDPSYKYYAGVSLVKIEKDIEKAAGYLEQAIKGSSVVKSLPSDAFFYLGRAQQMSGRFQEAIQSYKLYTEEAGKRTSKKNNVPQLIEQCKNSEGKVAVAAISSTNPSPESNTVKAEPGSVNTNPVAGAVVVKEAAEKPLPPEYSKIMDEALVYQHKADSLNAIAEKKRKELDKLPVSEQAAEKSVISEALILAASYQTLADNKYAEADVLMNGKRSSADSTIVSATATTGKTATVSGQNTDVNNETGTTAAGTTISGSAVAGTAVAVDATKSVEAGSDTKVTATPGTAKTGTDTSVMKSSPAVVAAKGVAVTGSSVAYNSPQKVEIYKYFEINLKPVADPSAKIPVDAEIPAGLIYRIQIGAFRNPLSYAFFKGITPIHGFKSASSGVTTYYVGLFRRMEDAKKALAEVRTKGFKDSFIVSQADGKSVSADRAAVMEKEWGKRPFAVIGDVSDNAVSDTIPPSLVFRVEAIRSLKPVKDDVVEELKKVAGNRGLDILSLENGNFVCLIGKFITFTSASEYADLLNRNGYRDAKVVAWLGNKEIPVETARQLFDNP